MHCIVYTGMAVVFRGTTVLVLPFWAVFILRCGVVHGELAVDNRART